MCNTATNLLQRLVFALMCLPLINCSTLSDRVEANDQLALSYRVKATKELPHRLGIAVTHQGVSGSDTQNFVAQTRQNSNGITEQIRPAATTKNDFSLQSTAILGKWNALDTTHFGINLYVGGAYIDRTVNVIEPNEKTTDLDSGSTALTGQGEFYAPINDKLRLTANVAVSNGSFTMFSQLLSIDYQITKAIQLNLGYSATSYNYSGGSIDARNKVGEFNFNSSSDISLTASGLLLGAGFTF